MPTERTFYVPSDIADIDYYRDIGDPSQFPYTRGLYPAGYNIAAGGRPWTIRMFSGHGSAEDTNRRYRKLLRGGQTGLSVAFDMSTLYGYDTDDESALGEFGTCGVACSSVRDMDVIFKGIDLSKASVSMTINSPAAPIWAMFIAAAERQGAKMSQLKGTLQNDILKEFIAQKEQVFPPVPSVRLVVDTIEFATQFMPEWNSVSISGYHIREAGSTAPQELAFTIADGMAYVEACMQRGIPVDRFAPRLSYFFNSAFPQGGATFWDEVAKFRASRRMWARIMRDEYKAQDERSWRMRFHTQTAGASLTTQQPMNNLTRVALQAFAGILGGTQSLHTDAYDEAESVPTQKAALLALQQQLILLYEVGVTTVVDPLGGSYYVERLTSDTEEQAREYIERIREMGNSSMLDGVLNGIRTKYMERQIHDAAHDYQQSVDHGRQIIVGVNNAISKSRKAPPLEIDPKSLERQLARLDSLRAERDKDAVKIALGKLRSACRDGTNVMPPLIEAAHAEATLSEMMGVMREKFGEVDPNGSEQVTFRKQPVLAGLS